MAKYRIKAVRTEKTADDPHEHITRVRISDSGDGLSRATVVADLRNPNGDRYDTYAAGETANVVVRTCPNCTFKDYITTDPDKTKKNNLLSLDRF